MVSKSQEQRAKKHAAAKKAELAQNKQQHVDKAEDGPAEKMARYESLFDVDKFDALLSEVEKDFEAAQDRLASIDREASARMRMIENEFFGKKKEHFESRKNIVLNKHKNFWPMMFLHHPNIELFLNLAAKNNDIQTLDLDTLKAIRGVELNVENTNDDFCSTLTLHFEANNGLFENSSVSRTVKYTDPHDDGKDPMENAQITVTELKPIGQLKKIVGDLAKDEANKANKNAAEMTTEERIESMMEVDGAKVPFIVQFTDPRFRLMNEFVESMKPIYNNPVNDIKNAMLNEDAFDDEDFSDEDDDSDDSDSANNAELDSIEEEPAEEAQE